MVAQPFLLDLGIWIEVKDGDLSCREPYRRHYSARHYRDGRDPCLFVGPGEKLVLLTRDAKAVFVWRRLLFSADGQTGINCALFRNEGDQLLSDLIRLADEIAWSRWPGLRHYTYINPHKIRPSQHRYRNPRYPGRCFLKAGWEYCGSSKRGLYILERLP